MSRLRVGVIGHVEHVTLGRVETVPRAGDIAHLEESQWFPGGGGGITFYQLTKSDCEVHLFTAIGSDQAGDEVRSALETTNASIHAVRRPEPHTRDIVMIDDFGERTIIVVGPPLHPRASDALPWEILQELDAVYFTAQDPRLLARARAARVSVVTARRRAAIRDCGVPLDVIIGSNADPREKSVLADYDPAPKAIVMTEGDRGGVIETATGSARFEAPTVGHVVGGAYGAGDSFAGAFVYFMAAGCGPLEAADRAAKYGAAVLGGLNPLLAQAHIG